MAIPTEPTDPSPPQVLASLDATDFDCARRNAAAFSWWSSHREFETERDALLVGYGFSGVAAEFQRVSFDAFERWSRITGAPLNVDGLDEFAAHLRFRARHPNARVEGRYGCPGYPERNAVSVGGVQRVLIRPEVYGQWRDDFAKMGLWKPPGLNSYAGHVVDLCLRPSGRSL